MLETQIRKDLETYTKKYYNDLNVNFSSPLTIEELDLIYNTFSILPPVYFDYKMWYNCLYHPEYNNVSYKKLAMKEAIESIFYKSAKDIYHIRNNKFHYNKSLLDSLDNELKKDFHSIVESYVNASVHYESEIIKGRAAKLYIILKRCCELV